MKPAPWKMLSPRTRQAESLESREVERGADDEYLADAGEHEH